MVSVVGGSSFGAEAPSKTEEIHTSSVFHSPPESCVDYPIAILRRGSKSMEVGIVRMNCVKNENRGPEQEKQKQGKKFERSGSMESLPHDGSNPFAETHAKARIPPLPKQYNIYKIIDVPRGPVLSAEELEARYFENLKNSVVTEVTPLRAPKELPVEMELVDITPQGTVLIALKDQYNLMEFKSMKKDLKYAFRIMKVRGWNVEIQPEDVVLNRIVVGRIDQQEEYLRAKITGFDDRKIHLFSIDYAFGFSLPYDKVFYMPKALADYPAQIQECQLTGLEKLAGTAFFGYIYHRIIGALRMNSNDLEADEQGCDVRSFLFTLIGLEKDPRGGGFRVEIIMPDEVAKDVSLATLIKRLARLDPLKDYAFTD